jgi:PBP1b-binding outer membrane lipoprotein LpoB
MGNRIWGLLIATLVVCVGCSQEAAPNQTQTAQTPNQEAVPVYMLDPQTGKTTVTRMPKKQADAIAQMPDSMELQKAEQRGYVLPPYAQNIPLQYRDNPNSDPNKPDSRKTDYAP